MTTGGGGSVGTQGKSVEYGLLAMRLTIAFIFLWHGIPKALDLGFAVEKFVDFGWPGWVGPVTGVVEVLAGSLLAVGLTTRAAAAVLAVIILGALVTVQLPGGFSAGLERDLLILMTTVYLAVRGPGTLSLDAARRRDRD